MATNPPPEVIDRHYGVDVEWQLYECSDCHPDSTEGEPDVAQYEKPYIIAVVKGADQPDECPRCESYLSLLEVGPTFYMTSRAPGDR